MALEWVKRAAGMAESSLRRGLGCTEASRNRLDCQAAIKPEAQCFCLLTVQTARALQY